MRDEAMCIYCTTRVEIPRTGRYVYAHDAGRLRPFAAICLGCLRQFRGY